MLERIEKNFIAVALIISSLIITSGLRTLAKSVEKGGRNAQSHFSSPSSLNVQVSGTLHEPDPEKTIDDKKKLKIAFKEIFDELMKAENKDNFISSKIARIEVKPSGGVMFHSQVKFKDHEKVEIATSYLYKDGFGGLTGNAVLPIGKGRTRHKYIEIRK